MPKAAAHSTQSGSLFHKLSIGEIVDQSVTLPSWIAAAKPYQMRSSQMQNFLHKKGDPVVALWHDGRRRRQQMNAAYHHLSAFLRVQPDDERAINEAQARADALGQLYEQTCDEICNTGASSLEGVLAKLQCATQCIRDTLPDGKEPEQACDIELRFVFAVERDVRRLIADARHRGKRGRTARGPKIVTKPRLALPPRRWDFNTVRRADRVT